MLGLVYLCWWECVVVEARPESKEVVELRHPPEEAVEPVVEEPLPEPGLDRPGDCEGKEDTVTMGRYSTFPRPDHLL